MKFGTCLQRLTDKNLFTNLSSVGFVSCGLCLRARSKTALKDLQPKPFTLRHCQCLVGNVSVISKSMLPLFYRRGHFVNVPPVLVEFKVEHCGGSHEEHQNRVQQNESADGGDTNI